MSSNWGQKPQYGEFKIVGAAEGRPKLLGEGSFGKTYEAVLPNAVAGSVIEDRVALKVLNPALLSSQSKRLSFHQEIQALTKFRHANLIHLIRTGETPDGEVYMAMELCAGGDLAKLVRRYGGLPERAVALIALQVAEGLKEMERRGLIHRDIKPTNIMLVDEIPADMAIGQFTQLLEEQTSLCRIVDFGLVGTTVDAAEANGAGPRQRFVGSPMYASPEQMKQKTTDRRTDIYALGMSLWYLAQGRGPLLDARGDELQNPRDAIERHLSPDEHESSLPAGLTQGFRNILARMVAKQVQDRYASARDLCDAIRHYLDTSKPVGTGSSFPLIRIPAALETTYQLHEDFPPPVGRKRYYATHLSRGERARVTIVEDLDDPNRIRSDYNDVLDKITELARRLAQGDLPPALLPVKEVVEAKDALAYVEEVPVHVNLASVIQTRKQQNKPISFREAVPLLRPVASALDFLIGQGWDNIFLPCEEVWLSSSLLATGRSDTFAHSMPLDEWEELKVKFSGMWVPPLLGATSSMSISFGSMTGSSFMSAEALRHPVAAFLRLVYRIVEGMEANDLADIVASGYDPTSQLEARSNNLIRDLLCNQRPRATVTPILDELCANEGIEVDVPVVPVPPPVGIVTATGSAAKGSTIPLKPPSATATSPRVIGATVPPPVDENLPVCEVVEPGVVIAPDDTQRRPQRVAPDLWRVNGTVNSEFGGKPFRLPRVLEALVIEPGVVRSPYAVTGHDQKVSWDQWRPGAEAICDDTGKRFILPAALPYPVASIPATGTGVVTSPYPPHATVAVAPEDWEPGKVIVQPGTGYSLTLPDDLPPLEAVVDVAKPGRFVSPFGSAIVGVIDSPAKWNKGKQVTCPSTGRTLTLPAQVEKWLAEAVIINGDTREIGSPFIPGSKWVLPATNWKRGGVIDCQASGRKLSLPLDLPALTGEVVGLEAGKVRSPYTGEVVIIQMPQWIPGGEVQCPKTGQPFRLPARLPLPEGIVPHGARPGFITSPFDPSGSFAVEPLHWNTGEIIKCQKTGLEFKLPKDLPLLEAIVTNGRFGIVQSPFAPHEYDVEVGIDDWLPGGVFECKKTHRLVVLPHDLPAWIVDGHWVPRRPGAIKSPFQDGRVFTLNEAEWKPGHVCEYEDRGHDHADHPIKRRFTVPGDAKLPALALEKAAVKQARANPESDEKAAANALKSEHPGATAAVIKAIWERHDIDTKEKRLGWQETGTVIPDEPGFVLSPYEGHARVKVDPLVWIDPKASVLCPDTKQRFLLPSPRPALLAIVSNSAPGYATSPFKTEEPFRIDPWNWNEGADIRCLFTGHPLRLPAKLPSWVPEAKLADGKPGQVIDPFSATREIVTVPGADWIAKKAVTVGGHTFKLPEKLPRLIADLRKTARGKVESPYAPGSNPIAVPATEWKSGGIVVCPVSGFEFELPQGLADDPFEGIDPREDGTIQSPYGGGKRFDVHPLQWVPEGIVCDEDGKRVILPAKLPLLVGRVEDDRPCEVSSPFASDKWMRVPVEHWEAGRELECKETHRKFRLPQGPLPAPEGTIVRPGVALSPWKNEVTVPPDQWEPGAIIEDRKNRRVFRVPKINVPLLEGRTIPGKTLCIRSPFDQSEVQVSLDDWRPGAEVICSSTHKRFVLPAHLDAPVLTARLIAEHRGWIKDPFTDRDYEVPAKDWEPRKIIPSETNAKRLIQLPEELPPLLASLIAEKPGSIRSPFKPDREIIVKRDQWQPGGVLPCRWTKRPIELPQHLPAYPEGGGGSGKPVLIFAALAACLALSGGLAWQFKKQPALPVVTSPPEPPPTPPPGETPPPAPTPPVVPPTPSPPPPSTPTQQIAKARNEFEQAPADKKETAARNLASLLADKPFFDALPPAQQLANLGERRALHALAHDFPEDFVRTVTSAAEKAGSDPEAQKTADQILGELKVSDDPAIRPVRDEALVAIAKRSAQKSGGEPTLQAVDDHLAAYAQVKDPEIIEWLTNSAEKLAVDLFTKVLNQLGAEHKSRFIEKATSSKKDDVAAQAFLLSVPGLEAIQSGASPLDGKNKLLLREAAIRNGGQPSTMARDILANRVEAKLASAADRQVFDPYSSDPAARITIDAADWKAGGVINKAEAKQFFRLPAALGALAVKFDHSKHVRPTAGKPGTIGLEGMEEPLQVPARQWYRGSKLALMMGQTETEIILPDDLPLLEVSADDARAFAEKEKKPVVLSPVTGNRIELQWTDWKPDHEIVEEVDGAKRVVAILGAKQPPPALDPKLACDPEGSGPYPATGEASSPARDYWVKSPYTKSKFKIDVDVWLKGAEIPDPDLAKAGVNVSISLPRTRQVFGTIESPLEFTVIDEKGKASSKLPFEKDAGNNPQKGISQKDGVVLVTVAPAPIGKDRKNNYRDFGTGDDLNIDEVITSQKGSSPRPLTAEVAKEYKLKIAQVPPPEKPKMEDPSENESDSASLPPKTPKPKTPKPPTVAQKDPPRIPPAPLPEKPQPVEKPPPARSQSPKPGSAPKAFKSSSGVVFRLNKDTGYLESNEGAIKHGALEGESAVTKAYEDRDRGLAIVPKGYRYEYIGKGKIRIVPK